MLICWVLKAGNGFSYPVLVAYKKKNVTEFDMLQINALFWKTTLFAGKKTLCASKIYFQLFHSYPMLALKFIILIWQADTQLKTHDLVDTRSKVNACKPCSNLVRVSTEKQTFHRNYFTSHNTSINKSSSLKLF